MKQFLRLAVVLLLVFSLGSCGLPGALARSGGRAVDGVKKLAKAR